MIIGLGNPGDKYKNTRHNIGFYYVDKFAAKYNLEFKSKFEGLYLKIKVLNEDIIMLKPQTFMNLSGKSVYQLLQFYNLTAVDILIIQDDLDMEFGKLKIKYDSSSGGHNGMKSIIDHLKTQKIARLKFGILNSQKKEIASFVLGKFSKEEQKIIDKKFAKIEQIILNFVKSNNYEEFQKSLNLIDN